LPFTFRSGGPGSGLYISRDGGANWNKVTEGMPEGVIGRIAVSVSPVNPNIVFALIESKKSALYKSYDKGMSWEKINDSPEMGARPFYFSYIKADPVDTARVYKPGYYLSYSENGGKNFRAAYVTGGRVHSDLHTLWISEKDNNLMYLGTDGGVYVSNDSGSSWRFFRNQPVSQFYHVSVDNQKPFNVYGGLQDNGSWMGPSVSPSGIQNRNWNSVGGGDGYYVFADRVDNNILYWQYQGGNIHRKYMNTGESKEIKPYSDDIKNELRFNWNTPVYFSPTRDLMYVGSQYLFRSSDKGDSWQRISPDLTTNDPEKQKQASSGGVTIDNSTAENHCTIFTISESPVNPEVIWAGTDDGNLQITVNGGASWTNVVNNITGLPRNTWVSSVLASRFDQGTAYATFDGHQTGDMTPYLFKTTDFGNTWSLLTDENIKGYCHKIIEDTQNKNLLFMGTESGLFVSIDGGLVWSQFKGNLPNVSVRDLVIQERENSLVIATHGRGIMVIDDLTPLRMITPDILQQEVAFLESKPYELGYLDWEMGLTGDDEFVGSNPQQASMIHYYMKKRHIFGEMHLEIYNHKGEMLREIPAGKRKGINRVAWEMRMPPPKVPVSPLMSFRSMSGPSSPPGEYTVKIVKGDQSFSGKIRVVYDPSIPHTSQDRDAQFETLMRAYNLLQELAFLDRNVTEIGEHARTMASEANNKTLSKKLSTLCELMDNLHRELVATNLTTAITGEEKLREKIGDIYSAVLGYQGKPTKSQVDRLETLSGEVNVIKKEVDLIIANDLPNLSTQLAAENLDIFSLTSKEDFLKEE
jgi:photosystem II stability/assembly factor-like uncharacterized protein